jgi:hypothetical protein
MRERFLGIVAVSALLYVAYHASLSTTSGWAASAAERGRSISPARAVMVKPVRDGDAVVGRPHDGIAALPIRRAHIR